jgi:hypothetical protein
MTKLLSTITMSIFFIGCNNNNTQKADDSENKIVKWISDHEEQMNLELVKRIEKDKKDNPVDSTWTTTIVITENDTTVLGILAKMVKKRSVCEEVEYTYSQNNRDLKKINILPEEDSPCDSLYNLHKSRDTLKYFIVNDVKLDFN